DESGISCAYGAGFIYGQLKNYSLKRSAHLGNIMMSFCAEKLGCRSNFPNVSEFVRRSTMLKQKKYADSYFFGKNEIDRTLDGLAMNATKITYSEVGDNY